LSPADRPSGAVDHAGKRILAWLPTAGGVRGGGYESPQKMPSSRMMNRLSGWIPDTGG
jgi:hypothetical protein